MSADENNKTKVIDLSKFDSGKTQIITDGADAGSSQNISKSNSLASFLGKNDIDIDAIALSTDDDMLGSCSAIDTGTDSFDKAGFRKLGTSYDLMNQIADGGQGKIYLARDRSFKRILAVKTLHPKYADKPDKRNEFLLEAKLMAQLDHPSVIPIYDVCTDETDGIHLAMKLIDGKTLRDYLRKLCSLYSLIPKSFIFGNERKSLMRRLNIFLHVCDAISYAHHKSILHRDLKPENIMLGRYNEVFVLDWGIAEHFTEGKNKTVRAGTVNYTAPEIITSQPYDQRSDVYALGLILYEIVFLKQGYGGDSKDVTDRILRGDIEPFTHNFGCPVEIDLKKIILKATHPEQEKRYSNVHDFAEDIRHFLLDEETAVNPDTPFTKFARNISRNKRTVSLVMTAFICLLAAAVVLLLVRGFRSSAENKIRESTFEYIYSNGFETVDKLERQFASVESVLRTIAVKAEDMLNTPDAKQADAGGEASRVFYGTAAGASPKTAPPDFAYSPNYGKKVSLEAPVYCLAPGVGEDAVRGTLGKLVPVGREFFGFLKRASFSAQPGEKSGDEIKKIMLYSSLPAVSTLFLGFRSGLHVSYPYHDDYSKGFDPRKTFWYQAASKAKGKEAVWLQTHMPGLNISVPSVTCAVPLFSKERVFLGCAAADMPVPVIVKTLRTTGNIGNHVEIKYLVDDAGRILADTTEHPQGSRQTARTFPDMKLFASIRDRRFGRINIVDKDGEHIYFFMKLNIPGWFYIEKADYNSIFRAQAKRAGRK